MGIKITTNSQSSFTLTKREAATIFAQALKLDVNFKNMKDVKFDTTFDTVTIVIYSSLDEEL